MGLLRSLIYPPFAWLWSGQTISRLGDALYRIALSWWVLEKTGSATIMGTVMIFSFTPMLIFLLIGGVAVDRFPRLLVMLLSDGLRALTALTVARLAAAQLLEVWHIYVASIVFGFVDAFFHPAYTAIIPELTPNHLLPGANSLTSLSAQFANIAGPALGAWLVAAGGSTLGFAVDGVSFLLSAVCILAVMRLHQEPKAQIMDPASAATQPERASMAAQLKEGLQVVLASPWLWITIAIAAITNVTMTGPMNVALPFLISNDLGKDVDALGLVYSFNAVGSVLAALWLGRYARLRKRGWLAYGGWMISGIMVFLFGLHLPFEVVLAASLINGAALMAFGLVWVNTLQELVPSKLLGRVSSIDALGSYALIPIGSGVAGVLTDQIGASLVFVVCGLITALMLAGGLLHPAIRGLD